MGAYLFAILAATMALVIDRHFNGYSVSTTEYTTLVLLYVVFLRGKNDNNK